MLSARQTFPLIMLATAETIVWAALFYIFPIFLLRWEDDFGWSRGEVALGLTVSLAVSALASPLSGRLIDNGWSRFTLPGAAAFGGVCLIALTFVSGHIAFLGVWGLIGLACAACLYEPCFSFLTRIRGTEARGAITTVTLIAGFASTISFPAGDALADLWGWRVAAQIFAAVVILVAVPLFAVSTRMLEARASNGPPPSPIDERAAARAARARPAFWLLAAAFPLVALTHGMIISNIIPIMSERGASDAAAVFAASLIGPMQVAGRVVIMTMGRRAAPHTLSLIAMVGVAAAILILISSHAADARIFVFVTLLGACWGVMSITRPLVAAEFLGRRGFGAISGALAVPFIACAAAAPFVAVLLWQVAGYDLTLAVGAGATLIGAGFLIAAGRAARH